MTDAVQVALIVGLTGAVPSLVNTIIGFINSSAIRRGERHMAAMHATVASTQEAIVTLEKNTNSIKDALVKVTGEAEFAKGKLEGAAETAGPQEHPPFVVKRQEGEQK